MTDHDPREASAAALYDLMTGEGSSETYRATAAIVHALHDVADAIRDHGDPANTAQDATGSSQSDEQPESGQVDTPDDPDAAQGNVGVSPMTEWPERFTSKIEFSVDGCWRWKAHRLRQGYGWFRFEGRMHLAHRVAYKLEHGEFPALPLDHLCKNTSCVRPSHLEPVTVAENNRRGSRSNWEMCRKGLHEWKQENIRVNSPNRHSPEGKLSCRPCENAYQRGRRAAAADRQASTDTDRHTPEG